MKKDLLAREIVLDEKSLEKIRDKWYIKLFDIRIPEMQDNLRHILHYMEKLIETHNFRKLLFEEERSTFDEMYVNQAQSQSIYLKRMEDLHKSFLESVDEKKKNSTEEFTQIDNEESIICENMKSMLFLMEQNKNQKEDQMNCEMFLKIDDEKSKNTERLENLRGTMEKRMEKKWEDIGNTIRNYNLLTQKRRKEYTVLKTKDDADSKIITEQTKKIQKMSELKEIRIKGERILTLFRICRKFETEIEKIRPVGDTLHLLKTTEMQDKRKTHLEEKNIDQTGNYIERF
ncbi:conserved hypothetical protein [Pediculus humanus corporis]|uniref:Uncharacterized protein n=1 Tax=Pediculus humanus subsp. corporis TaxID=121224 RepID=E0VAH0_PEDHC|nr:uncharacterized protein Phum_PHUM037800 [Pediculus humanus corporis]EEB10376.1 conserved hypothetical protein [Pediculus humanus corporis]